jgi:hypothetical protein
MELNKSQKLIIGTISAAVFGVPDIQEMFTKEIVNIVMTNPPPIVVFLVSIIKVLLVIASITWLIQLVKNIEINYNTKSKEVFRIYLMTLVITGITTIIVLLLLKKIIHL